MQRHYVVLYNTKFVVKILEAFNMTCLFILNVLKKLLLFLSILLHIQHINIINKYIKIYLHYFKYIRLKIEM